MERLNRPQILNNALQKYKIPQMFDTPDIEFHLIRYQKGEQLTSPTITPEQLMFLVKGTVQIYSLLEDGVLSPVTVQRPCTILGDIEFITGKPPTFFVEAKSEVLCVTLHIAVYQERLHQDIRFLNTLLESVGSKFNIVSQLEVNCRTIRERLLYYLNNLSEDGCIHSVNDTMIQLRCSRRQLQRVLAELCRENILIKEKKGGYRLKIE